MDAMVLEWAARIGAPAERHAELLTVADLSRIDYFDSFPQLAHRVTPWLDNPGDDDLVLTSASCYGAYFSRAWSTVGDRTLLTVRQTCRRRERAYTPLRRQREFQMREVVMIGGQAEVRAFLDEGREAIGDIAASLGTTGDFLIATDPFFKKDDERLLHQKLFPTKQEFTDASGLAIASVNSHRNFFGERCDIRLADGTHAFTGCIAFGLERWVDALIRSRHESA
ncbi:hypothetical protein [Streptomyces sp. NPDC004134]|uniref:hypothetical protein n=1 Tax=Streptomyces sp. NPDC004134 TaxID=3364691 RepID=UPI00368AB375